MLSADTHRAGAFPNGFHAGVREEGGIAVVQRRAEEIGRGGVFPKIVGVVAIQI